MSSTVIHAQTLLRGAWLSLEQAGHLLRGAVALSDAEEHVNGLALAMLAREEVGRHDILIALWRRAKAGESITVEEVRFATGDHVRKQIAGARSVTIVSERGNQFDKLTEREKAAIGTPDYQAARDEVMKVVERRRKQLPHERHKLRCSAEYVDLDATGTSWLRPHSIRRGVAVSEINDAMMDYKNARQHASEEFCDLHQEMAPDLDAWPDRPGLPDPSWPSWAGALDGFGPESGGGQ